MNTYPPSPEERRQELIGALIVVIGMLAAIVLSAALKHII
jgi:hypothetical protein